jgi:hypothetical protein
MNINSNVVIFLGPGGSLRVFEALPHDYTGGHAVA